MEAIQKSGSPEVASLAIAMDNLLWPWSLGPYLQGLSALAFGEFEAAQRHFSTAIKKQPTRIAPWLGWATVAHRQGGWDEICQDHPHLDGVELLPYDAGDENTFLELSESEREKIAESFRQAATSLGNYLAIAELCRSKQQISRSWMELKKAA